ncbi:MAG: hypothetical protein HZC47_05655 [Methanobacterium sp.]|uniref:hypothetical protein n=1 Tax=Methanobacterium sp. TaxID=2164 RepID=UPI003D651EA9|nr:hypothetical protein [Methanobacterium sp.]
MTLISKISARMIKKFMSFGDGFPAKDNKKGAITTKTIIKTINANIKPKTTRKFILV